MSNIGPRVFESRHCVMAPVLDAEPRDTHGRRYQPRSIEVTYKRTTDHGWRAGWISLYGPQIRKDGTLGTREINEVLWIRQRPTEPPAPGWAWDFYLTNLPTDGA